MCIFEAGPLCLPAEQGPLIPGRWPFETWRVELNQLAGFLPVTGLGQRSQEGLTLQTWIGTNSCPWEGLRGARGSRV